MAFIIAEFCSDSSNVFSPYVLSLRYSFFLNIFCWILVSRGLSEVLKQVWDLSDQDNDSMLSLREFCVALYFMERHREGQPLPTVLPSGIMFDETTLPVMNQPVAPQGNTVWRATSGSHIYFYFYFFFHYRWFYPMLARSMIHFICISFSATTFYEAASWEATSSRSCSSTWRFRAPKSAKT